MRPEFLGLTMVAGALVGFGFAGMSSGSTSDKALQQRSEYVGLDPASLPLVDCAPTCRADILLGEWQEAHPDANILESRPRFEDGRLIGYDITYEE